MFSTGSNNIYNNWNLQPNFQNQNFVQNNLSNFQGNIDSLIEYKFNKSNQNIQSGNFYQIKNNFFKRVYIIPKTSFEKLSQLNFNNNISNSMFIQNHQQNLIFYTTINELMNSITQTNTELYFVKEEFFMIKRIQVDNINHVDLYKDENKIILFFPKERQNNQILELKMKNNTQDLNQLMINNMNLNTNPKENTLKKLILLLAFEKEFQKLMKASIIDEYDIKEFYLININIIAKFKEEHDSFMQFINIKFDFSYKGFSKNLQKIVNMHQNNILNNQQLNNYQLNNIYKDENNFKTLFNKYWDNFDYPYEFILVPENLFDLFYNDFTQHNIPKEDFKYNVLIGNDVLFVQNQKNNCIFNAYKINNLQNGTLEAICAFKYNEENNFYSDVKKYIKGYGLEKYFIERKLDKNSVNQIISIYENNMIYMQYIFLKQTNFENPKILAIKNEFKRNRNLFELYKEFIKSINILGLTNIEINNINDIEKNIQNLKIIKCVILLKQNLKSIHKKLYFDKIAMLEKEMKQNNFNLENNHIINDIMNNPNPNDLQEILNNAFIFDGIKIDDNYKNKSVFSYINLNLILSINESTDLAKKFKDAEANLFINKNNFYLYYPNSKKLFKIINFTQSEFALEEVNFEQRFIKLFEKLKELIKDEDEEKDKLKYSIKYMSKPNFYYCINQSWLDEFKKLVNYEMIKSNPKDSNKWNKYMEQNKNALNILFNNQMKLKPESLKNIGININMEIPTNFGFIKKEIFDSIKKELTKIYNINLNINTLYKISFGAHRVIIQDTFNAQLYLLYIKIESKYELDFIINIQDNKLILSNLFENCVREETLEEILELYYKINIGQKYIQNLFYQDVKIGEIFVVRPKKEQKMKEGNHCLGLQNIGATCYMNATIQCLCHVSNLKKYFLNKELVMNDMKNRTCPLTKEFCDLINNLWKEDFEGKNYYAPHGFKDIISKMNPLFQGIAANDSKDLIIFLYENIHREINNPQNQNKKNQKATNIPELQEFRLDYYPKNSSIIIDTFFFEHQNQIKCLNCQSIKTCYNIYNILIFPLEKVREFMIKRYPGNLEKVTLENCFENYQENEILNGSNQIYCNVCHQMSDAANINMIYNSPEVLTIILNRGKGIQFDVCFEYPLFLNIDRFIIDQNCKNNNYELICVLSHLGPSGMSGHFIAFCKSPVDGKWYMYNDAQVNECSDPRNSDNTMIENLPYVLFYQRYHGDKNKITLFIKYIDKEVYLDVEKDITINELIKRINAKYEIPINILMYLEENNRLIPLNNDRLISSYSNIKDGAKIIAKIY